MDKVLLSQIGRRIYNCRRSISLTQEQLAEKMDVSVQMISNLERGNKEIKISNLIRLSSILGVSLDYLLTGKEVRDNDNLSKKISKLSDDDCKYVEMLVNRLLKADK